MARLTGLLRPPDVILPRAAAAIRTACPQLPLWVPAGSPQRPGLVRACSGLRGAREEGVPQRNNMSVTLTALADLRAPQTWFPAARKMRRKWVLHMGPTNSGKTYHALSRLVEAKSGAYCGPLRLLAWEVHDKLCMGDIKGVKVPCNLLTGQEKVRFDDAKHTSSTIEMVDMGTRMEVGVVDEMQMIQSNDRGWAWTRAILGLQVEELHLCGEPRSLQLMQQLCEMCGDDMEVKEYERLSPLKLAQSSLGGSLSAVQSGDCVVAFSRKSIYEIKREIETHTPYRCCVVYGSLPPETRREQARLFNDRRAQNGFDIMVASDAVGMGLNLEIKRIVFSTAEKFDGLEQRPLRGSEILQIAGRAGRFGTESAEGTVCTLRPEDMPQIKEGMTTVLPPLRRACIRPEVHMLEVFARGLTERWRQKQMESGGIANKDAYKDPPLGTMLSAFMEVHKADGLFFLTDAMDELQQTAELIEHVQMPLKDRFIFCMAPVDVDNVKQRQALTEMAQRYGEDRRVPLLPNMFISQRVPDTALRLKECEEAHATLELYKWLGNHFDAAFFERDLCEQMAAKSLSLIDSGLQLLTRKGGGPEKSRREVQKARREEKRRSHRDARRQLKLEARREREHLERSYF